MTDLVADVASAMRRAMTAVDYGGEGSEGVAFIDIDAGARAAIEIVRASSIPEPEAAMCEHGHTDAMSLCNQCEARSIDGSEAASSVEDAVMGVAGAIGEALDLSPELKIDMQHDGEFVRAAKAAIAVMRSRLSAEPEAVTLWQPIETAPKDGDDILVHWDEQLSGAGCLVVSWDDEPPQPGWSWATLDGPYYSDSAFSHWMPLPKSPALINVPSRVK